MTVSKRKASGVVAPVGCALSLGCMDIPGTTTGPRESEQAGSTPAVAATRAQAERLRR